MKPRYRSRSIRRCSTGSGDDVVRVEFKENSCQLPAATAQTLDCCRSFLDLHRHAELLSDKLGYDSALIDKLLAELVTQGFLISDTSIIHSHTCLASQSQAKIRRLGIVTSQRPKCLQRCLASYAANVRDHAHEIVFFVSDDTSDPAICDQNLYCATEVQKQFNIPVFYIGRNEKLRLIEELVLQGIDPETVHFALSNVLSADFPTGANRNAFLLSTVGELALSVDDDTVCSISPSSHASSILALTSRSNPRSLWFYPTREQMLKSVQFSKSDFVGSHTIALGRRLSEFIPQFGTFADVDEADVSHGFMQLIEAGDGEILLTQNGSIGDCGFHSPTPYLTLQGSTRNRLLSSEPAYRSALSSREVANVVDHYTLADSPSFISYAFGFDNRSGLVPFFPVQRGDERIFSTVLRRCFSKSLTCHLPYAVAHDPPVQRSFQPDALWRDAAEFRMSDLVLLCIESYDFGILERDANSRLRALGAYLLELGSMPATTFWEIVRQIGLSDMERKISATEQFCQNQKTAPEFWRLDITRCLQIRRQMLAKKDFPIPNDLPQSSMYPEAPQFAQELIRRYGNLLKVWPDIVTSARNLKQKQKWALCV